MVTRFETKTLGDIGEIVTGKTPKTSLIENFGGRTPFITPRDFSGSRYILNTERTLSELGVASVKSSLISENSVCVTCIGSDMGKAAIASVASVTNQQVNSIIVSKDYDYKFIYYNLSARKNEILGLAGGSAQPILNKTDFSSIKINLPSLNEQRSISSFLSHLDDKIELNRQMNETLEAMAQALFKSWFVDFDPVIDNALLAGKAIPEPLKERAKLRQAQLDSGKAKTNLEINDLFPSEFEFTEELGWIPRGWDIKPLDEIADYLNGLALQKFRPQTLDEDFLPVLKIAQLRAGEPNYDERASLDIKPEYIVQDGDIIFSWSGSLLVDVWCGGKAALNQHLFKVTSESYPKWFYYYYTKHHLEEFQRIAAYKAVTMGHIKRSHLKEALCLVPDNLLEKKELYSLFEVILNRKIQNKTESKTLAKLRDTLLPKLMSGELRIADTEKLAENI